MTLENQHTDFKSLRAITGKSADWEALAKDCVCFANSAGGRLLIGIEDHGLNSTLKKRRASGKLQKPSADQKFPVRLEAKNNMGGETTV